MARLRRSKTLFLLLIAIVVNAACRVSAAAADADVPSEDAQPETGLFFLDGKKGIDLTRFVVSLLSPSTSLFSLSSSLKKKKKKNPAAKIAAYKQKERDRMFFLPSNATIPPPGNGTTQKTNPLGGIKQVREEEEFF